MKSAPPKSKKKPAPEKDPVRAQQEALDAEDDAIENVEDSEAKGTEEIVDLNEEDEEKQEEEKKKEDEITDDEVLKLRATVIKLNRQLEKPDKSKQKTIPIESEEKEPSIQPASRQIKKRVRSEVLDSEDELRRKTEEKK